MTRWRFLVLMVAALQILPACAQAPRPNPAGALPAAVAAPAPRTILLVGNSFTYGAYFPVRGYRANTVTDLDHQGIGGVPALFKRFTEQAGLDFAVSLETGGGKGPDFHFEEKRALIDKPWDIVILQGHSVLDRSKPGDPARHIDYAARLAALFAARNPAVDLQLSATWSRADMTYTSGTPWSGLPIEQLAIDVRRASDQARAAAPDLERFSISPGHIRKS